jgi:hypothetical protein
MSVTRDGRSHVERLSDDSRFSEQPFGTVEQDAQGVTPYVRFISKGDGARLETEKPQMYDLSQPNEKPGTCVKCKGTGSYRWGGTENGKSKHEGTYFLCRGAGQQTRSDIGRNKTYNRYKIASLAI